MEYPKIETLYERGEDFAVDATRLRRPEFDLVKEWVVTEKVDGTNIRAIFSIGGDLEVRGRTDRAQVPPGVIAAVHREISATGMADLFWNEDSKPNQVILYGEGYGAKIQKGGGYRDDQGFILFDVLVRCCEEEHAFWLKPADVDDVAARLGVDSVPVLSRNATIPNIARTVREGFHSRLSDKVEPEGVVCRPRENLFDQRGRRVMFKLKAKDFRGGRR